MTRRRRHADDGRGRADDRGHHGVPRPRRQVAVLVPARAGPAGGSGRRIAVHPHPVPTGGCRQRGPWRRLPHHGNRPAARPGRRAEDHQRAVPGGGGAAEARARTVRRRDGADCRAQHPGQWGYDRDARRAGVVRSRRVDPRRIQAQPRRRQQRRLQPDLEPGGGDHPRPGVQAGCDASRRSLRPEVHRAAAGSGCRDHRELQADLRLAADGCRPQRRCSDLRGTGVPRRRDRHCLRKAQAGRGHLGQGDQLRQRGRQGRQGEVGARLLQAESAG